MCSQDTYKGNGMNENHLNLATLAGVFADETKAREFLESKLWPAGPVCPHCACAEVYKLTAKPTSKKPVRPGVYKCKACRKQFTVRVGTIFEDSHIPLCKWLMALHLMTSSKKGVSSLQISRECGITIKSAWFLTHRIREAMRDTGPLEPLTGIVEADETYVGGKPRRSAGLWGKKNKAGRGTKKTPVMVLVQRDGSARCRPLANVNGKTLKNEIAVNVAKETIIMTDQLADYRKAAAGYGGHHTVNHTFREYSRKEPGGLSVHTNTAESFFALIKRGHYGIFHMLSKKHLHRYCDEFSFRWKYRHTTDGERMVEAIKGAEGKRLTYYATAVA
jgi:transposase-like protein